MEVLTSGGEGSEVEEILTCRKRSVVLSHLQSGKGGISIESAFALEVTKKDFW